MVYTHARSESGTKTLLGNQYKSKATYFFINIPKYPVLPPSEYPIEINKLEPYHIKNLFNTNLIVNSLLPYP